MIVHEYSTVTGEYLGSLAAYENPEDKGRFMYPANSTTVDPPTAPTGQVAVFASGQWKLFPDLRGTTYWLADQSKHTVTEIGPLPTGAITTEPPVAEANQQITYVNDAWVVTPDFIGTSYWTTDGTEHSVTALGPLPDGAILTLPPRLPVGYALGYSNNAWTVTPNAYNTQRAAAYPNLGDQLDMLWHAINSGQALDKTSAFYTTIAAVKAQFPKPDGSTA